VVITATCHITSGAKCCRVTSSCCCFAQCAVCHSASTPPIPLLRPFSFRAHCAQCIPSLHRTFDTSSILDHANFLLQRRLRREFSVKPSRRPPYKRKRWQNTFTQLDLLQTTQRTYVLRSSTSNMAATPVAAVCPLTELPTELLATICDLVAEGEMRPVLRIEIEQDPVTRHKQPRLSAFAGGLSGTCRQLRNEYSAALRRRIEVFMARRYIDGLPCLMCTTTLHYKDWQKKGVASKALQIYASATPGIRHDKGPMLKVHALAASVPIEEKRMVKWSRMHILGELAVLFVADGSKSDLSFSLDVPSQPPGEHFLPAGWSSLGAVMALEGMKQAVKGTKWAGNMQYYMLWFDYVVRYTNNLR
jgi:hypothetical protein